LVGIWRLFLCLVHRDCCCSKYVLPGTFWDAVGWLDLWHN